MYRLGEEPNATQNDLPRVHTIKNKNNIRGERSKIPNRTSYQFKSTGAEGQRQAPIDIRNRTRQAYTSQEGQ